MSGDFPGQILLQSFITGAPVRFLDAFTAEIQGLQRPGATGAGLMTLLLDRTLNSFYQMAVSMPPLFFLLLCFSAFVQCMMEALNHLTGQNRSAGQAWLWTLLAGLFGDLLMATMLSAHESGPWAGISLWILLPVRFGLGMQLGQILERFFLADESRSWGRPGRKSGFVVSVFAGLVFMAHQLRTLGAANCMTAFFADSDCGLMLRASLQVATGLYILMFLLPALWLAIRLLVQGPVSLREPLVLIIGLFVLVVVAIVWEARGFLPDLDPTKSTWGIVPLFLASMGFWLFEKRYPRAGSALKEQTLGLAEERDRLKGHNLDALNARLASVMEEERPYLDEDFRLSQLAALMNLTPQQMSYHLNRNLKKDFYTFLCEYRVRDAGALLLQQESRSVTSIAFAVGFNSRSVFYRVFKQTTGLTPSQYRATHAIDTGPGKNQAAEKTVWPPEGPPE